MFVSRRHLAPVAVLVALMLGLAVSGGPVSAQDHPPGLIPEGDWSDDQVQQMLDKIEETENVLPERFPTEGTYEELEATLAPMGFFEFGVSAPGGYDHWINPGWFGDEHVLNPEFSESVVYQEQDDGTWKLVAAMFMLAPGTGVEGIPDEYAWWPGWHVHPELCIQPDGTFGGVTDPEDPNCPEGTLHGLGTPMFHVWLEDPGCGHRFGGVGVGGLHCDHDDHEHGDDHGDDHDGGHDHGDDHDRNGPPPAPAVPGTPNFTG